MGKKSGWRGTRYRGSRGSNKAVLLVLIFILLAAAAAGGWVLLNRNKPAAKPAAVQPPINSVRTPEPTLPPAPEAVRGIYISGPVAGDPYMDTLLALLDETELNAVVIDVKNDEGNLTYRPAAGTAVELEAYVRYIQDLPGLVARLKERGVYTIARIAAFKDPLLAEARPELALRYTDGTAVSERGGAAWVNPCEPEVWAYLEEIALGAAEAGFDEVQFDYVRFPTGKAGAELDLGETGADRERSDIIAEFLETVTTSLHAQGVRVSADVFGTVITNRADAALIGQDYARLAGIVDYVCPMVYPSHYAAGTFGLEVPDQQPYETVYGALSRSAQTLFAAELPQEAGVRAWLQDFTATWVRGHLDYGAEELRAQIQAVYDAGYTDWLLWNARNVYTADGLLPAN